MKQRQILLQNTNKLYKYESCDKEFKKNDSLKKHFNFVNSLPKTFQGI